MYGTSFVYYAVIGEQFFIQIEYFFHIQHPEPPWINPRPLPPHLLDIVIAGKEYDRNIRAFQLPCEFIRAE